MFLKAIYSFIVSIIPFLKSQSESPILIFKLTYRGWQCGNKANWVITWEELKKNCGISDDDLEDIDVDME